MPNGVEVVARARIELWETEIWPMATKAAFGMTSGDAAQLDVSGGTVS